MRMPPTRLVETSDAQALICLAMGGASVPRMRAVRGEDHQNHPWYVRENSSPLERASAVVDCRFPRELWGFWGNRLQKRQETGRKTVSSLRFSPFLRGFPAFLTCFFR